MQLKAVRIFFSQVVIDFGLSYNSTIHEDKAVDLYVLERAFSSAHAGQGPQLVRSPWATFGDLDVAQRAWRAAVHEPSSPRCASVLTAGWLDLVVLPT